jgi:hypothetical protein
MLVLVKIYRMPMGKDFPKSHIVDFNLVKKPRKVLKIYSFK